MRCFMLDLNHESDYSDIACGDNTAWRRALRRDMARRQAWRRPSTPNCRPRLVAALLIPALPLEAGAVVGFCWPVRTTRCPAGACRLAPAQDRRGAAVVVAANALWLSAPGFRHALAPDRYGIPTPTSGAWIAPSVLLLPINAFDGAGYRLGYGGGYFDRTLAALTPRPLAVGSASN